MNGTFLVESGKSETGNLAFFFTSHFSLFTSCSRIP